jgi:hypothetical protein
MSSNLVVRVFVTLSVIWSFCGSRMEGSTVSLAWNPSLDPSVAGYSLYYGSASHQYDWSLDAGADCAITVDDLVEGVTYFFAIGAYNRAGTECVDSEELVVTISSPPVIILEPSSQTVQAGATVVMSVDAIGTPPLAVQWFYGGAPVAGATSSALAFPKVSDSAAGNYTVTINNYCGSVISAEATLTVINPPPLSIYMSNELGNVLHLAGDLMGGKTRPIFAAVSSTPSAAGTYNGLFYQTDGGGMPAITLETAGSLTQCAVDAQGNFTGSIYIDGLTNSVSGAFDATGNGSATVSRAAVGLPDLGVALQLDASDGALLMTGVVSNLDQKDPWSALLIAEPETNAFAQSPNFLLAIPSINGLPTGLATGTEDGGVMSLFGLLGNGTLFSQNAPVSEEGSMALFVQLDGQSGLLAGWLNVFANPPTCLLTWICPPGFESPGFTEIVEATIIPVP